MESPRMRSRRSFSCKEPGCGRSFIRQEHLQRHRLNHQPAEIFSCDICPKSFVRQDLYRRHKSRHAKGMFFRNTGGVVHPSSSSSILSSSNEQNGISEPFQNPHIPVMQIQNAGGMPGEDIFSPGKSVLFASKDNGLNSFWAGCNQVPSVQDGLDWFFEPLQDISDLVDPSIPQFEPDAFTLRDADNQAARAAADEEALNNSIVSNTDQHNDWNFARSSILESLDQLDIRVLASPFFEVDNLKMFFDLYFKHYHPHFPIIHSATFSVIACHPLLLIAILNLGSAMAMDEVLFDFGQQVHHSLRLIILNSGIFEPPIPLWCLQALLLVQAYGKMISSRRNYEMAHIFHGTILTVGLIQSLMMKRGSIYLTASTSQSTEPSELPQISWRRWISEESWRRTAFFAFVMDAQHACVFGHSPVLSVIDMPIALPCLEPIWECPSAESWQALNRPEMAASLFLPTLKSLLRKNVVSPHCSEYARFVLLHGLMSLQTHLQAGSRLTLGIEVEKLNTYSRTPDPHQPDCLGNHDSSSYNRTPVWANTVEEALDTWSTSLFSLQPSLCLEAARPLHRVAQITLHVSVLDIHTLAMDPYSLSISSHLSINSGTSLANTRTTKAMTRLQRWAHTESARSACRYALLLVQETMFSGRRYLAREDNVAPRPWCLFVAVLTLWVYGLVTEGPVSDSGTTVGPEEYMIRMTRAMQQANPTNSVIGGTNEIAGLIRAVRDALTGCRWELLQEAHLVLRRLGGETLLDTGGDGKTLI
ncbi:Zinc finger protein klf1 [Penicillium rolfsii]|nr:Zinc finger protein klf1 [Penicillium rolfsii]